MGAAVRPPPPATAPVRRAGRARGLQEVELSWILEDNLGVRRLLEALGGDPYKRYRIYEKALG